MIYYRATSPTRIIQFYLNGKKWKVRRMNPETARKMCNEMKQLTYKEIGR